MLWGWPQFLLESENVIDLLNTQFLDLLFGASVVIIESVALYEIFLFLSNKVSSACVLGLIQLGS